jgi:AraC family transcriptional regulator
LKIAQEVPRLEHLPPQPESRFMQSSLVAASPTAGVSVIPTHNAPGSIHLPPIDAHRLVLHASPATLTYCRESGKPFLRHWGDIDLVPSGEAGGFDAESPYESLEIRFARDSLERVAVEMGRAGSAARLQVRHMLRNDRVLYLVQALEEDRKADSPSGPLYAESIGVALAIQLLGLSEERCARSGRLSNRQLRTLCEYIDAHLDEPLTVSILSREVGASSSYLRALFKTATGMTIHRYVLRKRVERARLLLSQGRLSTSEVALAAGFSHQSHLARWMRREYGYTPGRARKLSFRAPTAF